MLKTLVRPLLWTTLCCIVTTIAAGFLLKIFDLSNVVMLFLINVVFVSLTFGRTAGIWACILGVGCFDFFFVPPQFLFAISDIQYIFTFLLMVIVALVTSELAVKLRREVRFAKASADRATALARVASDLSGAVTIDQIEAVCRETLAPLFTATAVLLTPDRSDQLGGAGDTAGLDLSAAQRAYDLPPRSGGLLIPDAASGVLYLPLAGPMATRGVLALRLQPPQTAIDRDDRILLEACCASIALALERIHFADVAQETQVRVEGERLRNALLAAVSHDLRTPLTAIRGLADTLANPGGLSADEQMLMAGSIRSQSEELQRLIGNLLDAARLQGDGVFLRREWHALGEIVGIALERSRPAIGPREVRIDLSDDVPLIEIDSVLFDRVLENILNNAAKYTEPTATIFIRSVVSDGEIEIRIEDNGTRFPLTETDVLFEPFTRGPHESTIHGVGLGLFLCRRIVEAHGGVLRAFPRRPAGACFEIRLPRGEPPQIEREGETAA